MKTNQTLLQFSIGVEVVRFVKVRAYGRTRFGKLEKVPQGALPAIPSVFIKSAYAAEKAHYGHRCVRAMGFIATRPSVPKNGRNGPN